MKKSLKRNCLAVLTLLFVFSIMLCVGTTFVHADSKVFSLESGASVRLVDPKGIRFSVNFNTTVYNELFDENGEKDGKTLGMIIVPKQYLTDYETYVSEHIDYEGTYYEYFRDVKQMMRDFTFGKNQVIDNGDGTYQIRAALVNILFENLNLDFVGIGYIRTEVEQTVSFEYVSADYDENARSIADVAYNGLKDHYNELNGTQISALRGILNDCFYQANGVTYDETNGKYYYDTVGYDALVEVPLTVTAEYKVEHYKIINGVNVLADTDTVDVPVGTLFKATAKPYDGFGLTYDSVDSASAVIEGGTIRLYYGETATLNDFYNSSVGRIRTSMWGDFAATDGMVSKVSFDNKQAIKLDILPDAANVNWRREIVFNLEEIFGADLDNISQISFKVYLGNAYQTDPTMNYIELCNWQSIANENVGWMNIDNPMEVYAVKHLAANSWNTLKLYNYSGTAKYICFNVGAYWGNDDGPTHSWGPTYTSESAQGELTSDYCIYFADFAVKYADDIEYAEMSNVSESDEVLSWTAVAGATGYQIKVGDVATNVWTNIGNVLSYDCSVLGGGDYRYAVRAVFSSGYSAANIGTVHVVDPMIYEYKNAAVGLANTQLYADGYEEHEDSVTFVQFAGKDAIRFDMMPDVVDNKNRRDIVIDLEEVYGADLANISEISFKVYLGNAFSSVQNLNCIELCNWSKFTYSDGLTWINKDYIPEPYIINHLETGKWVTVNIIRNSGVNSGANSKYLDVCVSTLLGENYDRSWIAKYNEEIAGGELTSDYAVYFADFTAAYSTSSTYTKMSTLSESNGVLSWTAVTGATAYEIRVGDVKNGWTNIGNVLSYKGFDDDDSEQRVAVRAVFASGYSAASIIRYDMLSHTEQMMDGATGNVEMNMWQGNYAAQDNMISLVTFDGKESIKLDLLPNTNGNKRRALAIDMQEIVGGDLSKIATISFKYNLGTAFKNGTSYVSLSGWISNAELPYYTSNLFLIDGVYEDANCYSKNNSTWYEVTLKPQASGNSRYVLFMIECTDNTWGATYNDEISGGELTSDYSVYFADFAITYSD